MIYVNCICMITLLLYITTYTDLQMKPHLIIILIDALSCFMLNYILFSICSYSELTVLNDCDQSERKDQLKSSKMGTII